jgi:hypothetical protein
LAQLGKSEADNLRKTLIDAQLAGLTGADSINQQRQGQALSLAGGTSSLATPNLGQTQVQPSTAAQAMGQAVSQRAAQAALGTPRGNPDTTGLNSAYSNAIKTQSNPNFGLDQAVSGLRDLGSFFTKSPQGTDLAATVHDWVTGGPGTVDQWQNDYNAYAAKNPDQTGDWWTK